MLNEENLRNEVAHLCAAANNFIMELNLKGDEVLKGADIMQRCHFIFKYIEKDKNVEENGNVDAGVREDSGSVG